MTQLLPITLQPREQVWKGVFAPFPLRREVSVDSPSVPGLPLALGVSGGLGSLRLCRNSFWVSCFQFCTCRSPLYFPSRELASCCPSIRAQAVCSHLSFLTQSPGNVTLPPLLPLRARLGTQRPRVGPKRQHGASGGKSPRTHLHSAHIPDPGKSFLF